jgi:HD-like signal output (HDOD) protein
MKEETFQQIIWDVDVTKLAELIEQDPAICAQILKAANSVHYSRAQRINTVKSAVVHMGMGNIKSMLFAIAMIGVFKNNCSTNRFDQIAFWKHSIAGALIAARIAEKGYQDVDTFYIAALLRNIGILAIRQFMPGEFEKIIDIVNIDKISFADASLGLFRKTHRTIAYMIGLRWNLPRTVIDSFTDKSNPFEETSQVREVKSAIESADVILKRNNYAQWDVHSKCAPIDFDDMQAAALFDGIQERTDSLYEELWT